ncbi:hypothetical protein BV25DRAFT_1826046 [Artomyces pyxidatus]|uniref:Uncharacterized protein n=1 Tax=Artomyces pyxidatus TaxID=48021 RepID=A0ACB8T2E5_9AGAM|nr:hypothetical protein BV25DRAFT_1826046 [Artomyces pyxidatus]
MRFAAFSVALALVLGAAATPMPHESVPLAVPIIRSPPQGPPTITTISRPSLTRPAPFASRGKRDEAHARGLVNDFEGLKTVFDSIKNTHLSRRDSELESRSLLNSLETSNALDRSDHPM